MNKLPDPYVIGDIAMISCLLPVAAVKSATASITNIPAELWELSAACASMLLACAFFFSFVLGQRDTPVKFSLVNQALKMDEALIL
ncbi:MAG: hypothetical protein RL095_1669 [Verrucomicrobiota bacterium]|jgi:hypothetical protein